MGTKAAGIKWKREVLTLKVKQEILDRLERGIKPSFINAGTQLWKINNIRHKEKQGADFGLRLSHGNSWRCQEKEDAQKGMLRGHGEGYILVVSATMCQSDSHPLWEGTSVLSSASWLRLRRRLWFQGKSRVAWQFQAFPWDSTQFFFYNHSIHRAADVHET